jgi:hypothetical protein
MSSLKEMRIDHCFVGKSGEQWVGIFSEECEESAGEETPKLAKRISEHSQEFTFGICIYEELFKFWIFREGKLLDQHPLGWLAKLRANRRTILDLCLSKEASETVTRIMNKKPDSRLPSERLGVSEEEYYKRMYSEMARMRSMTPEQLKELRNQYKEILPQVFDDAETICKAIGIQVSGLNYSDFADGETGVQRMYQFQQI